MKVQLSATAPLGSVYFLDPSKAFSLPIDDTVKEPCAILHPSTAEKHPDLVADLESKPFPHRF